MIYLKMRYMVLNIQKIISHNRNIHVLCHKKLLRIILLVVYGLFLYSFYAIFSRTTLYREFKDYKYVQLYTGVFDWKDWNQPGLGKIPFKDCPEKRCFAFKPYKYLQTAVEEADGVMVHGPNLWYLPSRKSYKRNPKQIWMYYSMESPRGAMCSSHYTDADLDDWFNLTATYKQDSDFVLNYSPVDRLHEMKTGSRYLNEYKNIILSRYSNEEIFKSDTLWKDYVLKSKTKKAPVFWFVSHCETAGRRENFVKELRKYVDIDIYGKCWSYFENTLPDPCPKGSSPDCMTDLMNSYKFYLSFENSLCDDYISEKYWKLYNPQEVFKVNLLPITRGATEEQFKKVTFPNSYLNAYNFKSPKELGERMSYLNRNATAFLEYFEWKRDLFKTLDSNYKLSKDHTLVEGIDKASFLANSARSPFCKICERLHNETYINSKTNRVWKLSEWFGWKTSCWDQDEERRFIFWVVQKAGFCF